MSHPTSFHGPVRPGRRLGAVALAALLALGMGLWSRPAAAKSQKKVSYSYERVWPAVVRFLRVNEGFEIVEKDVEAGYVIFTVTEDGKRFRGSMEIVRVSEKEEQPALLLLIGIEDRPEYMEQGILDRFEQKLRAELGSPRPARPAPAAPAKPKEDDKPGRQP